MDFEDFIISPRNFKTESWQIGNQITKEIKEDKDGQVVVIKPTSEASYKNLVDALDEMAICSIAKYAIVDMAEGDQYLLENFKTKGAYGASAAPPKQ